MKFFVSRQCEFPNEDRIVEIAQGGRDRGRTGMITPMYPNLGEGKEFNDPREAVSAAINIRNEWSRFLGAENPEIDKDEWYVHISFDCTMGFTMTDDELLSKADEMYSAMSKCEECLELMGDEAYGHDFMHEYPFCSEKCAEKNYQKCLSDSTGPNETVEDDDE